MKDTRVLNENVDIKLNALGIKLYHLQSFISIWQMHVMYYKIPWYHNQTIFKCQGPSWPWSYYGSLIYNYLCNRCISPLMLWVRLPPKARCTTLSDKVCQWLSAGRWFSPGLPVSSTNKTDRHEIS